MKRKYIIMVATVALICAIYYWDKVQVILKQDIKELVLQRTHLKEEIKVFVTDFKGVTKSNKSVVTVHSEVPQCKPHTNLMFMKTHKTASTALQNVLLRFAENKNLQVGLPVGGDIRFQYGQKFSRKFVLKTNKTISLICHHMIFNYQEVKSVMPNDTKFITIIRETSSLFESLFDYLHGECKPFSRIKKSPNALEKWLDNTSTYFKGKGDGQYWWFAKNGVFFDLGYDNLNESDSYIANVIEELNTRFHLVLLADYFDESMILLKDLMCWDFQDILFLKTNARKKKTTTINDSLKKKIYDWNKSEAMLYKYFNDTFWKRVNEYGIERMNRDIKHLHRMNEQLKNDCVKGDAISNEEIKNSKNKAFNPVGVSMMGYNIKETARNNATCVNLLKAEIPFTFELKKRLATEGKPL